MSCCGLRRVNGPRAGAGSCCWRRAAAITHVVIAWTHSNVFTIGFGSGIVVNGFLGAVRRSLGNLTAVHGFWEMQLSIYQDRRETFQANDVTSAACRARAAFQVHHCKPTSRKETFAWLGKDLQLRSDTAFRPHVQKKPRNDKLLLVPVCRAGDRVLHSRRD